MLLVLVDFRPYLPFCETVLQNQFANSCFIHVYTVRTVSRAHRRFVFSEDSSNSDLLPAGAFHCRQMGNSKLQKNSVFISIKNLQLRTISLEQNTQILQTQLWLLRRYTRKLFLCQLEVGFDRTAALFQGKQFSIIAKTFHRQRVLSLSQKKMAIVRKW